MKKESSIEFMEENCIIFNKVILVLFFDKDLICLSIYFKEIFECMYIRCIVIGNSKMLEISKCLNKRCVR